jgi:hypothetical protein
MPGKVLLTDDYLLRMIMAGLQTLAKAIGLKTAGHYQEAQELIDQGLESLFGMRADLLKRLDDETLFASLMVQGSPDTERIALAAKFFQEEGDLLTAQRDQEGGKWSYIRALNFSLEAALNGKYDDTELQMSITYLVNSLKGIELPPDTGYGLFCYYEESGSFKEADVILRALENQIDEKAAVQNERAAYYNRLLERGDAELVEGGFARGQVVDALHSITQKKPFRS